MALSGSSNSNTSACNAGDLGSIPGLGRSTGEGNTYPLCYSDLENPIDSIVCGVIKSQTRLSDFHPWLRFHASIAEGTDSIPNWGTKIPYAMWHGQNKTKRKQKYSVLRAEQEHLQAECVRPTDLSLGSLVHILNESPEVRPGSFLALAEAVHSQPLFTFFFCLFVCLKDCC